VIFGKIGTENRLSDVIRVGEWAFGNLAGLSENGWFGQGEMRRDFFVKWLERGQRSGFMSKRSITFNNVQKRLKFYKKSDETFENIQKLSANI
jgi:hypothetical protein